MSTQMLSLYIFSNEKHCKSKIKICEGVMTSHTTVVLHRLITTVFSQLKKDHSKRPEIAYILFCYHPLISLSPSFIYVIT